MDTTQKTTLAAPAFTSYAVECEGSRTVFNDGQWGRLDTNGIRVVDRIRTRTEADRLAVQHGGRVVTLEWGFVPSWA